jgi:hypothetical protein
MQRLRPEISPDVVWQQRVTAGFVSAAGKAVVTAQRKAFDRQLDMLRVI